MSSNEARHEKQNKMKLKTKELIFSKNGEIKKTIKNMINHCRFDRNNRKIYVGYYLGFGKYTTSGSAQKTIVEILNCQGYKYKIGNDSKKNGVLGDHVEMSLIAFEFIYKLSK